VIFRRPSVAALMRLRSYEERAARRRLGSAMERAAAAEAERVMRERAYRELPFPGGVLSPAELRALQLQGIRTVELLAEASTASRQAHEHAEGSKRAWLKANDDLESVRKLDRRRRQDAARAARRAAERALDRLVLETRGVDPWR
jgi:hypothetical protein